MQKGTEQRHLQNIYPGIQSQKKHVKACPWTFLPSYRNGLWCTQCTPSLKPLVDRNKGPYGLANCAGALRTQTAKQFMFHDQVLGPGSTVKKSKVTVGNWEECKCAVQVLLLWQGHSRAQPSSMLADLAALYWGHCAFKGSERCHWPSGCKALQGCCRMRWRGAKGWIQ